MLEVLIPILPLLEVQWVHMIIKSFYIIEVKTLGCSPVRGLLDSTSPAFRGT